MRRRMMLALFLATLAVGPASAQDNERGGIRTETMSRLADQDSGGNLLWNILGLFGLFGLLGLHNQHDEDSYHPSPVE